MKHHWSHQSLRQVETYRCWQHTKLYCCVNILLQPVAFQPVRALVDPALSCPCGPCSELYYDFAPERGVGADVDLEDDSRFIEFYNLVRVKPWCVFTALSNA
eukprot:1160088-Pelagomonas_calceolata.AAC.15